MKYKLASLSSSLVHLAAVTLVLGLSSATSWAQTSTQDFGTATATQTSATGSAGIIPNPTSGTTWARGGAVVPNAPINVANTGNPLGTSGSFVRAVASTSASVAKFSPMVGYTGGTEFYTKFKVLFGDSSASTTAASGKWKFYQGAGAMYSDASDFTGAQVFVGLTFTYGAAGAITFTYRGGSSDLTTGLTSSSLNQGTVYTIEIIGNNKTSGTISYTYNGAAQTVAVQKFDLYINGTLVGDDLAEALLPANTSIASTTFIGISSTANVANIFVDDVSVYNAVPAVIGAAVPSVTASAASGISTTAGTLNGNVTADGGSPVLERGFVYKTSSGVTISDSKTIVPGTSGAFTLSLTSLGVNAQYFYCAYATNINGTSLSAETNFWTLAAAPVAPVVNTPTPNTLNVTLGSGDGNPGNTVYAIQETGTAKFVQADGTLNTAAVYQTATTWSTVIVSGLSPSTAYTFKVKAQNGAGTDTAFGPTTTGTTAFGIVPPSVTTQAATALTTTSATLNGTVTASNGAALTDRGFFWQVNPAVTLADNQLSAGGTAVSAFNTLLASLTVNTVYYYRAYAVNSAGTNLDSTDVSFYTLANPPTVPTVDGIAATTLNVTLGTGDGNPANTVYAVQETSTGLYVQSNGVLSAATVYQPAANWGTKTVSGLSGSTTYTFRIKAQNGGGIDTAFSPVASGTTLVAPVLVAGWDFQTTTTGGTAAAAAPSSPLVYIANFGSGTNYLDGSFGSSAWTSLASSPEVTSFGGTAVNAGTGFSTTTTAPACLALANTSANGKSIVFAFSMANRNSLVVSYATQKTSSGFSSQQWDYSTDGATWTAAETVSSIPTSFATTTLATINALDNVSTAYLRLTVSGATTAGGNNRLDNIQLNAMASGTGSYTVTYSGNGNTGGTAPTDASSPYAASATVTVLGNTGSLTKTGYTFAGWNTTANGNGTSYAPSATFTIAANTTLYAQWTPVVVTTPVITGIQVTGGNVLIDFTGGTSDGIGDFSVVGTTNLTTALLPVSATITTSGPGVFRATIAVNPANPAAFYRIKR